MQIFEKIKFFSGKEERRMDQKAAAELRREYPNHVPVRVAAGLLGVSPRQLAALVTAGREPYCKIGANIGIKQNYVRIYTDRLIQYVRGEDLR
jgi:hypothetical protein